MHPHQHRDSRLVGRAQHLLWRVRLGLDRWGLDRWGLDRLGSDRLGLEPVDERGGGRNSDEGMHIGAGAVIAGTIAAGIGAFIASKLGALR
jgi:hypothetical protein